MPEAFLPLTDFVNEAKSIPKDHSLDQPVAKWVEDEILEDEIVEAGVAILFHCARSISSLTPPGTVSLK